MNANECLILDDEELERTQVNPQEEVINPRDMRSWLPETLRHQNPFNSGYVSTSHAFPKIFQKKEDFPKLSERTAPIQQTTMNYRSRLLQKPQATQKISTINVLERVREVLQEEVKVECRTCSGNHWTVTCEENQLRHETPPPYSPHTPPYPFDSPVLLTSNPPINEIIYPLGTPMYPTEITPVPQSPEAP